MLREALVMTVIHFSMQLEESINGHFGAGVCNSAKKCAHLADQVQEMF